MGPSAQEALLEEVEREAYRLVDYAANDVGRALGVMRQYADLEIGLADASIVILAARFRCDSILTLDERHFRVVKQLDGKPFRLLPADA